MYFAAGGVVSEAEGRCGVSPAAMKCILAVNAGSSNVKATVYAVDKVGDVPKELQRLQLNNDDDTDLVQHINAASDAYEIVGIGHRLVHGGPKYGHTVRITDEVKRDMRELAVFDPEHTPAALKLIEECERAFPDIPQFASFDTAFFHDLPRTVQLLPLPRKYFQHGLRRYGFHGLSYTYLQQTFRELAGEAAVNGRVIYAHLGSGASLAATQDGKPIDTTMAFTPASGVVMSTRAGDLDPSIGWFLQRQYGISAEQYNHLVNFESGLLGISGRTGDMKTLLDHESSDTQAAEAIEIFCHRIAQAIAALATSIGGVDSLIFSGGIGEQSAILRQRICDKLAFLGIKLDKARNSRHEQLISASNSPAGIHIIPTDETSIIAQHVTKQLMKKGSK